MIVTESDEGAVLLPACVWTPRVKLPPCPICEEDELHVDRWANQYAVKCLSCGWHSGIHILCGDDGLLDGLIAQLVAVTAAGYNAVADKLLAKVETPAPSPPKRELTSQQRVIVRLMEGSVRQLERGTRDEQHTAAALRMVVDSIERGYVAELVRHTRKWAAAREGES